MKTNTIFFFLQIKVKKDELEVFRPGRVGRLQKVLWDLFEKPHTSIGARVWHLFIHQQPAHTVEYYVTNVHALKTIHYNISFRSWPSFQLHSSYYPPLCWRWTLCLISHTEMVKILTKIIHHLLCWKPFICLGLPLNF